MTLRFHTLGVTILVVLALNTRSTNNTSSTNSSTSWGHLGLSLGHLGPSQGRLGHTWFFGTGGRPDKTPNPMDLARCPGARVDVVGGTYAQI
jgi:hypothetical protein